MHRPRAPPRGFPVERARAPFGIDAPTAAREARPASRRHPARRTPARDRSTFSPAVGAVHRPRPRVFSSCRHCRRPAPGGPHRRRPTVFSALAHLKRSQRRPGDRTAQTRRSPARSSARSAPSPAARAQETGKPRHEAARIRPPALPDLERRPRYKRFSLQLRRASNGCAGFAPGNAPDRTTGWESPVCRPALAPRAPARLQNSRQPGSSWLARRPPAPRRQRRLRGSGLCCRLAAPQPSLHRRCHTRASWRPVAASSPATDAAPVRCRTSCAPPRRGHAPVGVRLFPQGRGTAGAGPMASRAHRTARIDDSAIRPRYGRTI